MDRRLERVKKMHDYIINVIGDDEAYMWWAEEGIPDCPTEDDFIDFAEDTDQYLELCELFTKIIIAFN